MYYQNYEDYMRSVLGYPTNNENQGTYFNEIYRDSDQQDNFEIEEDLDWYPEIYKIVYPMVCKTCDDKRNTQITNDLIDNITNIVYTNIEVDEKMENEKQPELRNGDVPNPRVKQQERRETRQFGPRNPLLRDLIRILVVRELFDRRRPHRPHNRPVRPQFPGGPGMPPPPPMPRYY